MLTGKRLAPAQGKADAAREICDLCGLELRHTALQVAASSSLFWAAQVRICGLGHWLTQGIALIFIKGNQDAESAATCNADSCLPCLLVLF